MVTIVPDSPPPPSPPVSFELNSVKQTIHLVETTLRNAGYMNIVKHAANDGAHWMFVCENPQPPHGEELFYLKWERELFHKVREYVPSLRKTQTRGACSLNLQFVQETLKFNNCTLLFANAQEKMIY